MEVDVVPSALPAMRSSSGLGDVTQIDLPAQVRILLASLNVISSDAPSLAYIPPTTFDILVSVYKPQCASSAQLLGALSETTAVPDLLELVLECVGPLASDLLARWCERTENLEAEEFERKLFVLAELASLKPEYWSILYDFLEQSPFLSGSPLAFALVEGITQQSSIRIQLLLLSYYRILRCDSFISDRHAWNAAPLVDLFNTHSDLSVRYMALQTYVRYKGIQEQVRLKMEKQYVGDIAEVDVDVPYGWEVEHADVEGGGSTLKLKMLDGWLIRLEESSRLSKAHERLVGSSFAVLEAGSSVTSITEQDLSSRSALIAGSLAFRRAASASEGSPQAELHIDILSHRSALRSLISHLSQRVPILITSAPSAGKTHTIRHLASLLYPQVPVNSKLLTISLADTSVDAKALIGNYVSSPHEPGTFVWAEGALVKAMRSGRWLVLEDLDKATVEVQSLFARLADSLSTSKTTGARAVLQVPGQPEVIEASQNFAIIATRTIQSHGTPPPPAFLGSQYYNEVELPEPDSSEVESILSRKFPSLAGDPVNILFRAYQEISLVGKGSMHRSGRSSRPYGLRDLERWCARVTRVLSSSISATTHRADDQVVFSNPVVQEEVFLEAFDVFLASLDTSQNETRARREAFGHTLASAIGLNDDRYRWLMDSRLPAVEITGDKRARQAARVRVGRTNLHGLAPRPHSLTDSGRPFAMTKPSALLLERIAVGVNSSEPLLLVGETGTGKTTAVQHLADSLERPLTVINLSMQTESGDLLGGFKPVEATLPARELHGRWIDLFRSSFSRKKNEKFEVAVRKAVHEARWKRVAEMLLESGKLARGKLIERLDKRDISPTRQPQAVARSEPPAKRRKLADDDVPSSELLRLVSEWDEFLPCVEEFVIQHVTSKSRLVFAFLEGPLVKCLRNGEWLLLDEVNLASAETLESLSSVLESAQSSVTLTEKGDLEPVPRHPGFRIFACMNPATDVGKKDLPGGLRGRFTEIYVPPPDDDREALLSIVKQYLGDACAGDPSLVLDVAEFYVGIKALAKAKQIVDGTNTPPHYSMRTLARALTFAVDVARAFGVRRGLWEGCMMTFTMSLDEVSAGLAKQLCDRCLLRGFRNANAVIAQIPAAPAGSTEDSHIRFGHYWLAKGPEILPGSHDYIITPSVQAKLLSLARTIMTRKYPVLIQGPTSSGKTSAIEFMARQTGHKFIRINNHEHTDIQEYLGSYAPDAESGKLVFQEGALVNAVRHGHWIVLDELNLAPTDVLEALNRLLDDNRELILPETQEVIKPHPNFMLFATQNPPGLYAGRKVLSRAFRNRFLEVHFEDVPKEELQTILCQRCKIPPSYAHRIVDVFQGLRHRRQATRVFESSQSFATLRDLFRWANRTADSYQQLADQGYMLLAERSRSSDDKLVVREVLEATMKVKIDEAKLYDIFSPTSAYACLPGALAPANIPLGSVIWTSAMKKLFTLTAVAYHYKEPLLLVGETGCGKTSVCELLAGALSQRLIAVNCHQNMEAADLLGSQRPVRDKLARLRAAAAILAGLFTASGQDLTLPQAIDVTWLETSIQVLRASAPPQATMDALDKLLRTVKGLDAMFEWSNGPLVEAMQQGRLFLLDELSLADDSVLERLNSVLEPGRTLLLAERGGMNADGNSIVAAETFGVVATMNPGGDFGKKELSPALRNRFTEVWVPPVDDRSDLEVIIASSWKVAGYDALGPLMLDFLEWFDKEVVSHSDSGIGLRDVLSWIRFTEASSSNGKLNTSQVFSHGAALVMIDGLESLPTIAGAPSTRISTLRERCWDEIARLSQHLPGALAVREQGGETSVNIAQDQFTVGPFALRRETAQAAPSPPFALKAPTTLDNLLRIVRACQLPKSILLEGSPGVGKTSLVAALAGLCGRDLCRINLSEQTDLVDLFGADLPVSGGAAGTFAWVDAGFLTAMKRGDWVLLDEMNLASQAVLEGLNAVLDHRGSVFIPELGRAFDRHPSFRVFAAQNPIHQGGGRKGLPKSFLNRFTKVYIREMKKADLAIICGELFPTTSSTDLARLIDLTEALVAETTTNGTFGSSGAPWEFNLRDIMRIATSQNDFRGIAIPDDVMRDLLNLIYVGRFRTPRDQAKARALCETYLNRKLAESKPWPFLMPGHTQIGLTLLPRLSEPLRLRHETRSHLQTLQQQAALLTCVSSGSMAILVGERGSGKREAARAVASSAGKALIEFNLHPGVDTLEMLGSYEQSSLEKHWLQLAHATLQSLARLAEGSPDDIAVEAEHLIAALRQAIWAETPRAVVGADALMEDDLKHQVDQALQFLRVCLPSKAYKPLSAMLSSLHAFAAKSSFEWIDGPLISALQAGDWFLISDANLCSGSVLDRLNSLCESGGSLVLSERGTTGDGVPTYRPHPDFRLILAFDPQMGELSRAMRNRGVEIHFDGLLGSDQLDAPRVHGHSTTLVPGYESSVDSALCDDERVLSSLNCLETSKMAYMLAARAPQDLSVLNRWRTRIDQRPSDLKQDLSLDEVIRWRRLRLSGLEALSDVELAVQNCLPFDFTIDRPLSYGPDLRIIYRLLRTMITIVDLPTMAPSTASHVLRDQSFALRGLLEELSTKLRSELRRGMRSLLHDAQSPESVIVGTNATNNLVDWLHLLEVQIPAQNLDFTRVIIIVRAVKRHLVDHGVAQALSDVLSRLDSAVAITRGLGQLAIWTAFAKPYFDRVRMDLAQRLQTCLARPLDNTLRTSLLSLLVDLQSDDSAAEQLAVTVAQLEVMTEATSSQLRLRLNVPEQGLLFRARLSVMADSSMPSAFVHKLASVMFDVAPTTASEWATIVHGLTERSSTPLPFQNLSNFLLSVFPQQVTSDGPAAEAALTQLPVFSMAIAGARSGISGQMGDLQEQERHIDLLGGLLLEPVVSGDDRTGELWRSLAFELLSNILRCFGEIGSFRGIEIRDDLAAWRTSGDGVLSDVVKVALDTWIIPLLTNVPANKGSYLTARLWLRIGLMLWDLYVPNVPYDPAEQYAVKVDMYDMAQGRFASEVEIYEAIERSRTGNTSSPAIEAANMDADALGPPPQRPQLARQSGNDPARLNGLFAELHTLQTDLLAPTRLLDLERSLEDGDDNAIARAGALQSSLASLTSRISVAYAGLDDLVAPVSLAISAIRVAISLQVSTHKVHKARKRNQTLIRIVQALATFPAVHSRAELLSLTELPPAVAQALRPSEAVVIGLIARTRDVLQGHSVESRFDGIMACYDRLFALWQIDQKKSAMREQANESMYRQRRKDQDVLSDEAQEAAEFRKLFPTFEDEDLESSEDDDNQPRHANNAMSAELSDDQNTLIHRMHLALFETPADLPGLVKDCDAVEQRIILEAVVQEYEGLDIDSDIVMKPLSLRLMADSHRQRASTLPPDYNFYLDVNIVESMRACDYMHRLERRLRDLIEEWPEQMVLQHILDRCGNMRRMSATSAVARLLPAFEQLLEHTNDWEAYANRENSLKGYRDEIIDMIVSWRKVELSLWHRIIPQQTAAYHRETASWLFKLYEMLVVALRTVPHIPLAQDAHLAAVHALLNDFMVSSSVGHFTSRLSLLASFSSITGTLRKNALQGPEVQMASRLHRVLLNFLSFYHQYGPTVTAHLDAQKKRLEKSVSDYVKLASWKDVNIQALKASAHKSHVQLYKLIRKYRDVLQQSVVQFLVLPALSVGSIKFERGEAMAGRMDEFSLRRLRDAATYWTTSGQVLNLGDLEMKSRIFRSKASQYCFAIDPEFSLDLEAYTVDLHQHLESFAEETRSLKGPDALKLAKNLLTRKRRALADGMKELRKMGFSFKVRADSMQVQGSVALLHQMPRLSSVISENHGMRPVLRRVEEYQHRLEVLMPVMRSGLADHHADLTTHDLVRVHGMVESVFEAALAVRAKLAQALPALATLTTVKTLLIACVEAPEAATDNTYEPRSISGTLGLVLDATASLQECLDRVVDLELLRPDAVPPGAANKQLAQSLSEFSAVAVDLRAAVLDGDLNRLHVASEALQVAMRRAQSSFAVAEAALEQFKITNRPAAFLLDPTIRVLVNLRQRQAELIASNMQSPIDEANAGGRYAGNDLLEQLLISMQTLAKSLPREKTTTENSETPELDYKAFLAEADRTTSSLRLERVSEEAVSMIDRIQARMQCPNAVEDRKHIAKLVLPFLSDYIAMASFNISSLANAAKSAYKTCYILCNLATELTSKGFCQPQEETKGDGQEQSGPGAGEATGFGSGTGKDDVTDTIEDEAQVEGLQGEDAQDDQPDDASGQDGQDQSHEMQDDFEGNLEDAADQDGEDDGENSDGDAGGEDIDDHVGDVGDDAVDEQFWSGEQEDQDGDAEPPLDASKDQGKEQPSTDMSAKEPAADKAKDQRKPTQTAEDEPGSDEVPDAENPEEEGIEDVGDEDDAQDGTPEPPNNSTAEDTHIPEIEPLALPDDLKMDDAQDIDHDDDDDDPMGSLEDDDGESLPSGDELPIDGDDRLATDDVDDMEQPDPDDTQAPVDVFGEDEANDAEPADRADGSGGGGGQDAAQQGQPEERSSTGQEEKEAAESADPEERDGESADLPNDQPKSGAADAQDQDQQMGDSGAQPEGPPSGGADSDKRSFGASLAEVRRLMSEILEQSGQERMETGASAAEQQAGAMEHVAENQDADMEALGAADEARQDKLAELQIVDQEQEGHDVQAMEVDDEVAPFVEESVKETGNIPQRPDEAAETDKALTRAQVAAAGEGTGGLDETQETSDEGALLQEELGAPNKDEDDLSDSEDTAMQDVSLTRSEDKGDELWRKYSALTNDLSFQLCEQMRLILEPTLATRLQGDFRSGKRLNMRKIIPYIASEYTKDKIWLRRTKPSRREYQVLLSLDDSRSMADSQSVHLAYQTMALVSQALSKLEVGQISVARFGDSMEVLHPFGDAGFTAKDGAKVMNSFGFEQHRTDVAKLLDGSLEYLQESRRSQASNSAADLWQLEIIISDGVCQDHPRLRTLLRKAVEQRVMVVFVVVDSLQRNSSAPAVPAPVTQATAIPPIAPSARQSILNMQSVSYKQVNGEMKLEMERYLDTFPFEYYVVLRDVQALPEVLSDTLRQWMTRVSSSEE